MLGVKNPPPSSTEDKERIQLYFYFTSGLSWPVLGRKLPLELKLMCLKNKCKCRFICAPLYVWADGTGFDPRWGLDFPDPFSRPRDPPSCLYKG